MLEDAHELRNHLFKVALLAGALLSVLVVNDVQRGLPLFQLQAFNFCLQLVELLLQVLALFHVLHPGHGHNVSEWLQQLFSLISCYSNSNRIPLLIKDIVPCV